MAIIMLTKIKIAIEDCQTHLNDKNANGTVIESYLTQHLLILLSADMQQAIYDCLDEKAKQATNQTIQPARERLRSRCFSFKYLSSTRKNIVREVKYGGIAGFVTRFGPDARQKFDDCLKDKAREITRYANAIKNRDLVAHTHGAQVTFTDIQKAVDAAELILSAVKSALDIDDPALVSALSSHSN